MTGSDQPEFVVKQSSGASSRHEAELFMARAEQAFRTADQNALMELFAEDVVVIFADFPAMRGKETYRKFLAARLARQIGYQPRTTVRVVGDNVIGSSWEASWTDAKTGLAMRGRGCEFVTIKDGKIVEFIASFNAWDDAGGPRTPII